MIACRKLTEMKKLVKKLVPNSLIDWRTRRIVERQQQYFASKSAAETFTEIYQNNLWGGAAGEFYSGSGSDEKYAQKYAETIKNFIADNKIKSVVDLGCGDFRIASRFVSPEFHYTGVDIVTDLVAHLQKEYADENVQFQCLNIIEEELPIAELCLIRQVLQHLSNSEIKKVLENCRKFKYLIVTEEFPASHSAFTPNKDIAHGSHTRVYFNSAVALDKPPFNLTKLQIVLEAETEDKTVLRSFLLKQ